MGCRVERLCLLCMCVHAHLSTCVNDSKENYCAPLHNKPAGNKPPAACGSLQNPRSHSMLLPLWKWRKHWYFKPNWDSNNHKHENRPYVWFPSSQLICPQPTKKLLATNRIVILNVYIFVYLIILHVCHQGNTRLNRLHIYFVSSLSVLAPECEFYLSSDCLISIFHHVKQIEDNEGRRDEGQTCALHIKRSICFQWDTRACCWRGPHWLCIRDWWSSCVDTLTEHPQCTS